jgi:hypothetical protein
VPYFRQSVYFEDLNKDDILKSNFISGHFGNIPTKIDDSIKSVTTLRNPIRRVISHYVKTYDKSIKNPIEDFENWFVSDLDFVAKNNMQSRFLINGFSEEYKNKKIGLDDTRLVEKLRADSWGIGNIDPTIDLANNALKDMLLVGKTEHINYFIKSLSAIMFEGYGIDPFYIKTNKIKNSNSMSDYIYKELDIRILKMIENNNEIDFNLWESVKH